MQELDKLKEYWVDGNYLYDREADALIEAAQDTVELIDAVEELQAELVENGVIVERWKKLSRDWQHEYFKAKAEWVVIENAKEKAHIIIRLRKHLDGALIEKDKLLLLVVQEQGENERLRLENKNYREIYYSEHCPHCDRATYPIMTTVKFACPQCKKTFDWKPKWEQDMPQWMEEDEECK